MQPTSGTGLGLSEADGSLGTLAGYELEEVIGRGGMATVYRALATGDGQEVAFKLLTQRYAYDAEQIERFRREAFAATTLKDPHILPVYDSGVLDGRFYMVMELMPGGSLKEKLGEPFDIYTAAVIVRQIADALQVAHDAGIIHRDVKPSNILFNREDEAMLADFGIAKFLREDVSVTLVGYIPGSLAYISPEQLQGQPLDGKSDQYLLGLVLYEMLAGRRPFGDKKGLPLMVAHTSQMPPDPRQFNPELSGSVADVVMTALAKNPSARYPDVIKFATALSRAVY
jgi:serine/threonine protein kinase